MSERKTMSEQGLIDKSEILEREMETFPSLYIEGAAATGKSVAVQMLHNRKPQVNAVIFDMENNEDLQRLISELPEIKKEMQNKECWLICENINSPMKKETSEMLAGFIKRMPEKGRAILVGRVRPDEGLLELLWKQKMRMIPQEVLFFDIEEIRQLVIKRESRLVPGELLTETGGWPGCVSLMIQMAEDQEKFKKRIVNAARLRECYEVYTYIRWNILGTLTEKENAVINNIMYCPWTNVDMCKSIWGMKNPVDMLDNLT